MQIYLDKHKKNRPNSCAIFFNDGRKITWEELDKDIDSLCIFLQEKGVLTDDVIVFIGRCFGNNLYLQLCYQLAAFRLGAIVAPIMEQPSWKIELVLSTLYKKNSKIFAFLNKDSDTSLLKNYSKNVTFLSHKISHLPLKEKCNRYEKNNAYINNNKHPLFDKGGTIIFTSGSTGKPKAIFHTLKEHYMSAKGFLMSIPYKEHDSWLLGLPLYHVSGQAIIYRWLLSGGILKIADGNFYEDIENVTHASLVLTQVNKVLESLDKGLSKIKLKTALLGGSSIPHDSCIKLAKYNVSTYLGYGMTELASTVYVKSFIKSKERILNKCFVLSYRAIMISSERIIYIKGTTLLKGYYEKGNLMPLKKDPSGFFCTNDIGFFNKSELFVIGRKDNVFISGGENIHPEEIEFALQKHPDIVQAFVIPIPCKTYGFRPIAVIEKTKSLLTSNNYCDNTIFIDFLSKYLERFKIPKEYLNIPEELLSNGIKTSRVSIKEWLYNKLGL